MQLDYSTPFELSLNFRAWVYRLWNACGNCLYVGKTVAVNPWMRIQHHKRKPWWGEVARIDCVEVYDASRLARVEYRQIRELDPKYNVMGKGPWAEPAAVIVPGSGKCARCGESFSVRHPTARFCSDACRQAAYRVRRDGLYAA